MAQLPAIRLGEGKGVFTGHAVDCRVSEMTPEGLNASTLTW